MAQLMTVLISKSDVGLKKKENRTDCGRYEVYGTVDGWIFKANCFAILHKYSLNNSDISSLLHETFSGKKLNLLIIFPY